MEIRFKGMIFVVLVISSLISQDSLIESLAIIILYITMQEIAKENIYGLLGLSVYSLIGIHTNEIFINIIMSLIPLLILIKTKLHNPNTTNYYKRNLKIYNRISLLSLYIIIGAYLIALSNLKLNIEVMILCFIVITADFIFYCESILFNSLSFIVKSIQCIIYIIILIALREPISLVIVYVCILYSSYKPLIIRNNTKKSINT